MTVPPGIGDEAGRTRGASAGIDQPLPAARRAEDLRASLAGHRDAQAALVDAATVRRQATEDAETLLAQAQSLADDLIAEARVMADEITARAQHEGARVLEESRTAAHDLVTTAERDAADRRSRAEAEVAAHLRAELAAADEQSRAVLAIAADRARRVHDELDRATRTVAALLADQRAGADPGLDLSVDESGDEPLDPSAVDSPPTPPPYVGLDQRPVSELSVSELAERERLLQHRRPETPQTDPRTGPVPVAPRAAEVPRAAWPTAQVPVADLDDAPLSAPRRRSEPAADAPTRPLGWLFRSNT